MSTKPKQPRRNARPALMPQDEDQKPNLIRYGSGATRSAGVPRFGLVPPEGYLLVAKRFTEGAKVHGDNNWKLGMPIEVIVSHIEYHINELKSGNFDEDTFEDHLGAIGWGVFVLAWYRRHWPTMIDAYIDSINNPSDEALA